MIEFIRIKCYNEDMRIDNNITSIMLIRVGQTKALLDQYNNSYIKFGCPANWISYNATHNNSTIGDPYECVFARVNKNFPFKLIKDKRGNPIGRNLLIISSREDDTVYLAFQPTILMPTLCLFNLEPNNIPKAIRDSGAAIDMKILAHTYGYDCSEQDISFMIIDNPIMFYDELDRVLPKVISKNLDKLTDKYYHQSSRKTRYRTFIKDVTYVDFIKNGKLFYEINDELKELFWKSIEYRDQSERRIVIPNIGFRQRLEIVDEYDYTKNELIVPLPSFQKYVKVIPLSELGGLCIRENKDGSYYIAYHH